MRQLINRFIYGAAVLGALCCFAHLNTCWAEGSETATSPLGFWNTEDHDGVVEIYKCENSICGRFYWLKEDNPQAISRDTENPDPSKRSRPLCHMQFMGDFKEDENNKWVQGWIYSPLHGQNFNAEMHLKDANTLDLHGYVVLPVFGQSQTWTRASAPLTCKETE